MNGRGNARSLEDESVLRELRLYRESLEAGREPDRAALLGRFPEIAGDLAGVLDGLDFLHRTAPQIREGALRVLGDFEIKREIGRGGMGVVYEAEQVSLQRRVALKTLPFVSSLDEKHRRRFENEARATARLEHAHIVPVHAVGCEQGVHYYAMQYIAGKTLAEAIELLRRGEGNGPTRHLGTKVQSRAYCRACAQLGARAARALAYAHQQGVVHRDIKPANLILDETGQIWVTDFGLAAFQQDRTSLTVTGDLVGTGRYMSPEQWSAGEAPVDHRTDVYSLGATLYELVTLERAFPGESTQGLWINITTRDPVPPSRYNSACQKELATILRKAMAKEPGDRYASALALADDLERFADDRPILARPPSLVGKTRRWTRRHKTIVAAALVLLVVGAIAWRLVAGARKDAARERTVSAEAVRLAREAGQVYSRGYDEGARGADEAAVATLRRAAGMYARLDQIQPDSRGHLWDLAACHLWAGTCLRRLGRFEEALDHLGHAVAARRKRNELMGFRFPVAADYEGTVITEQARALWEAGRHEEAVAAYRRGTHLIRSATKGPFNLHHSAWETMVMGYHELGLLLRSMGEAKEAREQFRTAAGLGTSSFIPLSRAWVLAQCPDAAVRDPAEAVRIERRVWSTYPYDTLRASPEQLMQRGAVHYRAGRLEEAIDALEKSMDDAQGGGGGQWYFAAMAHWKLGNKKKARELYARRETRRETRLWLRCLPELWRIREEAAALLGVPD